MITEKQPRTKFTNQNSKITTQKRGMMVLRKVSGCLWWSIDMLFSWEWKKVLKTFQCNELNEMTWLRVINLMKNLNLDVFWYCGVLTVDLKENIIRERKMQFKKNEKKTSINFFSQCVVEWKKWNDFILVVNYKSNEIRLQFLLLYSQFCSKLSKIQLNVASHTHIERVKTHFK